ncbi:MAG: CHC2 zinc finger domain-containing protein [Prolixibacteraceae bacterium]|jgi:hypothetical protein|nr:CHC2 zinc finger domain-containing protein [Prolixibacteraceae bacterium]
MIKKDQILSKVTVFDIYTHYLKVKDFSKNISSPFTEDKKSSFKVYKNGSFKCFSSGNQGDAFQLVAYLEGIDCKKDFNKVLYIINDNLNLGLNGHDKKEYGKVPVDYFNVIHRKLNNECLKFWEKLTVGKATLELFNVAAADKIEYEKDGELKQFKIFKGVLAFDYLVNNKSKVYIPAIPEKKVKKQFYKNQTKDDIFGFEQLPEHTENIIITAGEKDCLVLNANGFIAVCFQSEAMFPQPKQIRALKEKCNFLYICYDNDESGKAQAAKLSQRYNLINISIPEKDDINDVADYIPKYGKEAFTQLFEKAASDHVNNNYSYVFIKNGGYYKQEKVKGADDYFDKELTNFTINVIALISSETDPRRIVQIKSKDYTTEPFEFSVDSFISKNAFKKALESKGNFFFYGSDMDLMEIKKTAFAECEITREITDLGFDKLSESYVLSNVVIEDNKKHYPDKYGIVNLNKDTGIYIPASSILSDSDKLRDSKKFKLVQNENIGFNEFYKIFEEVHGRNAVMSIGFFMSALNFDVITEELNFFPLLLSYGPPRSGKSSISRTLLSIFGQPQEAVMLPNSTQASISGKMAQFKNALVWMDEFNNKKISPQIEQTLKGLYDLQGRLRKTYSNDNSTYSSAVFSAVTISGQEAPHDEALLSRCFALFFKKEPFSAEKFAAFRELDSICKKGLGNVLLELLKYRESFKKEFKPTFDFTIDRVNELLKNKDIKKLNSRLLQNYALVIASMSVYDKAGFKFNSAFSGDEILDIFLNQLVFQSELERDSNEVEVFWSCFNAMIDEGKLHEGIDFKIDFKKDILSFKPSVFDKYSQYSFHTTGEWGVHKSSMQSYLKDEDYFISNKSTVKFKVNSFDNSVKAAAAWQVVYSSLPFQFHKEIG